ncbi:Glycoside hydrolase family 3 domain protein [Croceitalea dokdonensis DOKDO 023]|uniref:beta-N-acetylhexosaminidase n=1 Tax=Croceitalea dokdonensis DOKDO 023 TaxID=1300341 RepID=A0A0P7A569_9FLAO|nr:glycoside hydrolase family 3 N-terminal domain-containing protein [Croceitalea dokdonensis]KPM31662.1 Glycoside hydrolase family 3 domain protein [Croceitalea dokdonensis DOKDO 023]
MDALMTYPEIKEHLTLRDKVGQLFMAAAFINDTEAEIKKLEQLIQNHCIGALCFFHSRASAATNFEGTKEIAYQANTYKRLKQLVKRYQKVAKTPLLMAMDAEWGLAMRVENTPQYPYAITLGAAVHEKNLIHEVGRNIAMDCLQAGIHWNLAPVIDINSNPNNPVIGYRSFGDKKELITVAATEYINGMSANGILNCIKHFPGHGDTEVDSHLSLPLINRTKLELFNNELHPFKALINYGVDAVMIGHLMVPALSKNKSMPATVSVDIIQGILRQKLGFSGLIISDALNMRAVSTLYTKKGMLELRAFEAGNDMLCFSEHIVAGISAILKHGEVNSIEQSFQRIWRLKEKAFRNDRPKILNTPYHDLIPKLAKQSLTLLTGTETIIKDFRKNNYRTLAFGKKEDTTFLDSLTASPIGQNDDSILIALYPPCAKPMDYFGMDLAELRHINQLLQSKKVVLYVFGNPYILKHLAYHKSLATVLAYQDFKPFQQHAAEHFLGKHIARGKLPVTIPNPNHG